MTLTRQRESALTDSAARWMSEAARFIRDRARPASTAEVIEAVRMANMLADFRHLPAPGEEELVEAAQCVLCEGEQTLTSAVATHLRELSNPSCELVDGGSFTALEDFLGTAKKLKITLRTDPYPLNLDLRRPRDLAKSQFLHQIHFLGIAFATPSSVSSRARGSFREDWTLAWTEASRVTLGKVSKYSLTIEQAVHAALARHASRASSLPTLANLAECAFMAGLPGSVELLLGKIEYSAGLASDFQPLAATIEPLSRLARYGNLRPESATAARRTALALTPRACQALPTACESLDDLAAADLRPFLAQTTQAIILLDDAEALAPWFEALVAMAEQPGSHPLLAASATRLLLAHGRWTPAQACLVLERELSPGGTPMAAARWVEGFFGHGSGSPLQHPAVLGLVNDWLLALSPESFLHCLPLLRRTFSALPPAERRPLLGLTQPAAPYPASLGKAGITPLSMTARLLQARRTP